MQTHVADQTRLVGESGSGDVMSMTHYLGGSTWDWKMSEGVSSNDVDKWQQAAAQYVLIDERTPTVLSYEQRKQTLLTQQATLLYESPTIGPKHAIWWLFRPQHILNLTFNQALFLIGYDVVKAPDNHRMLVFFWYTKNQPQTPYNLFFHVLDPATKQIAAQADGPVGGATHTTDQWRLNELIFDSVEYLLLLALRHLTAPRLGCIS